MSNQASNLRRMAKAKSIHPIRMVRNALKETPEDLRLRQYATAEGFSKLIGRSSSLIRNVECGVTSRWDDLARLIELKTKVSKDWLLSAPKEGDPIQDRQGRPWKPERDLDPLAPRKNMPDWRFLLKENPALIPELISQAIKAQLILDMSYGHENNIGNMISLFDRIGTFINPGTESLVDGVVRGEVERSMGNRAWSRRSSRNEDSDADIESFYGVDLRDLTLEKIKKLLDGEGFGWASKLEHLPQRGILADAGKFYDRKYRVAKVPRDPSESD